MHDRIGIYLSRDLVVLIYYHLRYTGCPKKNAILCLMGHRGHQEWTRDKSRVSFENLRKFPFWWAQKLPIFDRKWLRKMRSKMPTPPGKMAWLWITPKMFFFCSYFNEKIFDHLILTLLLSLNTMGVIKSLYLMCFYIGICKPVVIWASLQKRATWLWIKAKLELFDNQCFFFN